MNAFGIIAEYNPFHFGHEYLINKIKENNPGSVIAAVMSGDFVQRGEAAAFDKFTRAAAACKGGADLVIELPVRWSIGGAEDFAFGAVSILSGIGINKICFGSECGDIGILTKAAHEIISGGFEDEVNGLMKCDKSVSYAAARSTVLERRLGTPTGFFKQPNNILGIEYIKSALKTGSTVEFSTFERTGNAHDKTGDSDILSASDIRSRFFKSGKIENYVPNAAGSEYTEAIKSGKYLSLEKYSDVLLTLLSMSNSGELAKGIYSTTEIANSVYNAMTANTDLNGLVDTATSKTYTKAHIRRAILSGLMHLYETDISAPGYARILAANQKGREYIKSVRETARLPLISKAADIKKVSADSVRIFEECARAHDLYNMICSKPENRYREDWKRGPAML